MSHSHSSLLDLPPFPLPQILSSLLPPSRGDHLSLDPRTAGLFGRVSIQKFSHGFYPVVILASTADVIIRNEQNLETKNKRKALATVVLDSVGRAKGKGPVARSRPTLRPRAVFERNEGWTLRASQGHQGVM